MAGPTPYAPRERYTNPYAGSIADLIGRSGQAAADGIRRSGDISGQMYADLGKTVSGTIGSILKEQQDAPIRKMQTEQAGLQLDAAKTSALDASRQRSIGNAVETVLRGAAVTDPQTGVATYDRAKLQAGLAEVGVGPAEFAKYQPVLDASDAAILKVQQAHVDAIKHSAMLVDLAGNDPAVFTAEINRGVANKLFTAQEAQPYLDAAQRDPTHIATITAKMLGKSPELMAVNPGQPVIDKNNPGAGPVYTAPDDPMKLQVAQQTAADRAADNARQAAVAAETGRHNRVMEARPVAAAGGGVGDVKEAIAGMKDGTIPPQLPGRASKEYTAMMAEAHRQGYDLAGAATDWTATQKHIATLNGAQQTRMAQSIDNAAHSLDVIDELAGKWKGGKFPLLNKANLAAAKGGIYGQDVQQAAVALDAQIADVTSELGNVYMGGNSPTDHALGLAAKNLSADWSEGTLKAMTKQARTNLQIRQNSMRNVGVAGASADNPYAPKAGAPKADPLGIR